MEEIQDRVGQLIAVMALGSWSITGRKTRRSFSRIAVELASTTYNLFTREALRALRDAPFGIDVEFVWKTAMFCSSGKFTGATAPDGKSHRVSSPGEGCVILAWNDRVWPGCGARLRRFLGPAMASDDAPWHPHRFLVSGGHSVMSGRVRWLQGQLAERFGPPVSIATRRAGRGALQFGGVNLRHEYFDGCAEALRVPVLQRGRSSQSTQRDLLRPCTPSKCRPISLP